MDLYRTMVEPIRPDGADVLSAWWRCACARSGCHATHLVAHVSFLAPCPLDSAAGVGRGGRFVGGAGRIRHSLRRYQGRGSPALRRCYACALCVDTGGSSERCMWPRLALGAPSRAAARAYGTGRRALSGLWVRPAGTGSMPLPRVRTTIHGRRRGWCGARSGRVLVRPQSGDAVLPSRGSPGGSRSLATHYTNSNLVYVSTKHAAQQARSQVTSVRAAGASLRSRWLAVRVLIRGRMEAPPRAEVTPRGTWLAGVLRRGAAGGCWRGDGR